MDVEEILHGLRGVKGYYILLVKVKKAIRIDTRGRKTFELRPGTYLYVGSARGPGGLYSRLKRHLSVEKKEFWHIDYLLKSRKAEINEMFVITDTSRDYESIISRSLINVFEPIKGFGSSDKRMDQSHLFFCGGNPRRCSEILIEYLRKNEHGFHDTIYTP